MQLLLVESLSQRDAFRVCSTIGSQPAVTKVGQLRSQQVDNLSGRGKNSERRESSSVEHELTVNENVELPVGPADDLHVRV